MSIGIPRAVDSLDRTFDRWVIEAIPPPFVRPLRCGGCSARVEPVSGYTTRQDTEVDPLYRLAKGGSHDEGCPYDFDAQAGHLRIRHASVIESDGDIYVLVLNIALNEDVTRTRDSLGDPRSKLAFHRRATSPLHQTLRAASEIARLLRRFEHDPAAKERFRARYAGQTIAWEDFCFDAAHDLKRLHGILSRANSALEHPRAVVGRIEQVRDSRDGGSKGAYLAVREPDSTFPGPVKTSDGTPITPVLRAGDHATLGGNEGDTVVGYGLWTLWTPGSARTHYVTLWLDEVRGAVAPVRD